MTRVKPPNPPFQGYFHATFHAVISRILVRRNPSQRQSCPALVHKQVRAVGTHSPMRTGRKFASRFALPVRTLLRVLARTWLMVTSAVTTDGYQFARLPGAKFPLWLPCYCRCFDWQPSRLRKHHSMNDRRHAPRRLRKPNPMNDVSQPVNEAKSGANGPVVETPHE